MPLDAQTWRSRVIDGSEATINPGRSLCRLAERAHHQAATNPAGPARALIQQGLFREDPRSSG